MGGLFEWQVFGDTCTDQHMIVEKDTGLFFAWSRSYENVIQTFLGGNKKWTNDENNTRDKQLDYNLSIDQRLLISVALCVLISQYPSSS